MRIESISEDEVTLVLTASDAYRLSQACEAANTLLHGFPPDGTVFGLEPKDDGSTAGVNEAQRFSAFGCAFLASAAAAEHRMDHPQDWDVTLRRLGRYVPGEVTK